MGSLAEAVGIRPWSWSCPSVSRADHHRPGPAFAGKLGNGLKRVAEG
jgi:hypothetical protein